MNVELAMDALADAKAHPGNFNMSHWWTADTPFIKDSEVAKPPCGTTACYAGFASLRAAPLGSKIVGGTVVFPDGKRRHVETYAIEALGITKGQAWSLFYLRDIEEVERALDYLADNPDATENSLDRAAAPDRFEYV